MPKNYEAWSEPDDESISMFEENGEGRHKQLPKGSKLLYKFQAGTFDEAMAIHYLRQGFEPYKPSGEPEECMKCGSYFYPDSSGECWKCGGDGISRKKQENGTTKRSTRKK